MVKKKSKNNKKNIKKRKQKEKKCIRNVGKIDSLIRILLGIGFLGYGYLNRLIMGNYSYVLYIIALILIITGLRRKCLLYYPLNINTNKK